MDAAFLVERDQFVVDEVLGRDIPLVINLAGGYQEAGTSLALHLEPARIARAAVRPAPRRP